MQYLHIVYEGEYWDDQYTFEFVCGLKKTAMAVCRKEGYKHNKKQDLWLNEFEERWRRIDRIEYKGDE